MTLFEGGVYPFEEIERGFKRGLAEEMRIR